LKPILYLFFFYAVQYGHKVQDVVSKHTAGDIEPRSSGGTNILNHLVWQHIQIIKSKGKWNGDILVVNNVWLL